MFTKETFRHVSLYVNFCSAISLYFIIGTATGKNVPFQGKTETKEDLCDLRTKGKLKILN